MTQAPNAPSKFVWPPVIYGTAFLAAYAAGGRWPAPVFHGGAPRLVALYAGLAFVAAGLLIAFLAEISFLRAGTATLPIRPATALVTAGVYRHTRNPMYLGMTLVLAGFGLAANSLWYLAATPLAMFAVLRLAILPEEAWLTARFGAAYMAWKGRTRRWI